MVIRSDSCANEEGRHMTRCLRFGRGSPPRRAAPPRRLRCNRILGVIFMSILGVAAPASTIEGREVFIKWGADNERATGEAGRPFPTVAAALARRGVAPGDVIRVAAGWQGELTIGNLDVGGWVTVAPAKGADGRVDRIIVRDSRKVRVRDFRVWASTDARAREASAKLQGLVGAIDSDDVVFESLQIRSVERARDYRFWTEQEWRELAQSGVGLKGGVRNVLRNSEILGTRFAVTAFDAYAVIEGNRISGFSGDAMRALGDFSTVRRNYVSDCVQVDGNHADGFQSWSLGPDGKVARGTVTGGVIEANTIIEWSGGPRRPFTCVLQGIGMFDGWYRDWTIQNNLIVVSAWHGINVSGAIGVQVLNNTAAHPTKRTGSAPWVRVAAHRDNRLSRNNVVANNLAMHFDTTGAKSGLIFRRNRRIGDPAKMFRNHRRGDYGLAKRSPARDAGISMLAPWTDIVGRPRPSGKAADIGAFETY